MMTEKIRIISLSWKTVVYP